MDRGASAVAPRPDTDRDRPPAGSKGRAMSASFLLFAIHSRFHDGQAGHHGRLRAAHLLGYRTPGKPGRPQLQKLPLVLVGPTPIHAPDDIALCAKWEVGPNRIGGKPGAPQSRFHLPSLNSSHTARRNNRKRPAATSKPIKSQNNIHHPIGSTPDSSTWAGCERHTSSGRPAQQAGPLKTN